MKKDLVKETVLKWLSEGRYKPGQQLPTDIELAEILHVNRCTVGAGLRQLAEENLLERAPRRGTIVKRLDSTIPTTNAVALVAISEGEIYDQMVRKFNDCLHEKGLYPVLINSSLANNAEGISAFLTQMNQNSRPYGYLILGESRFPYDLLLKKPYLQSKVVFFFRYHWCVKYPHCRYVLSDYEELGRQVVNYFAQKGMKRLFFTAVYENKYSGEWSSMQVTVMKSIMRNAERYGIEFDEGLFWRTHSGARLETVLPVSWEDGKPAGFYTWQNTTLTEKVMPLLQKLGKVRGKDYELLGTFNTANAAKYGIDAFDFRAEEIAASAVELLVHPDAQKEVLLSPSLVINTNVDKNPIHL